MLLSNPLIAPWVTNKPEVTVENRPLHSSARRREDECNRDVTPTVV